jgi:hypothetical protein
LCLSQRPAVVMGRQDDIWEIQVAVLLTFLLQVLLVFLGPTRRRSSAIWSRLILNKRGQHRR